MLLKCVSVYYVAGSFALVQGIKKEKKDTFISGVAFRNRGTGWGEIVVSSELILITKNGQQSESFNVIPFFHSNWGKMTQKRREAIVSTMPSQIRRDKDGLNEKDMMAWLERAKVVRKST